MQITLNILQNEWLKKIQNTYLDKHMYMCYMHKYNYV